MSIPSTYSENKIHVIKLFMYYGRFDPETNIYCWRPTRISASFHLNFDDPELKQVVNDLRVFMGFDPTAPPIESHHLEYIIPKYFNTDSESFAVTTEIIEAMTGIFKNETASCILRDHVRACQDLYKMNPAVLGQSYVKGETQFVAGNMASAFEHYLQAISYEIPPVGLMYNLTLVTIALSALMRVKKKCIVTQASGTQAEGEDEEGEYKLSDILTNIMFNVVKRWFISDNDEIFIYFLIKKLRPNEYKKYIKNKQNVNVSTQSKLLFNYLLKLYPLEGIPRIQLSYTSERESTGAMDDWNTMVDKIDGMRGLILNITKTTKFQEVIKIINSDHMISEFSLMWAYLYKKNRLCRLMAYYGHQISMFGIKSREISTKIDHKEVQMALKQLFHELLDLLKVVIDEDFITQNSIGLETSVKVLKTLVKVYQFINTEKIYQKFNDKTLIKKV